MKKVNSVKEIKKLIDEVMLSGYHYKTNFSCPEFLVDIDSKFIIIAKPICTEKEFYYEFVLDIQFVYDKEITFDELTMIKNIINILEENRKFVLSKLKKYTVNEYKEELKKREEQSKKMLDALQNMFINNKNGSY